MKITRLRKIINHPVFRDFSWPDELSAFAQFNIIYGWNGSGKTAFSILFNHLQSKIAIEASEVEFELDGKQLVSSNDLPTANIPPVRVFNRDFVAKTIKEIDTGNVNPIYVLGQKSIEKKEQIEALKEQLAKAHEDMHNKKSEEKQAKSDLKYYTVDKAKSIKDSLLGSAQHRNYDRRDFRRAAMQLKQLPTPPEALSEERKKELLRKSRLTPKDSISTISLPVLDIVQLHLRTSELATRSVVSQLMDELVRAPAVGLWVEQGLSLHVGDYETDTCRFCGNEFSLVRQKNIEAHFNDTFKSLKNDLEQAIQDIKILQRSLDGLKFPDKACFYDHLANKARERIEIAEQEISSMKNVLEQFKSALKTRKENPFEPLGPEAISLTEDLSSEHLSVAIGAVNAIIKTNQTTTDTLEDEAKGAYKEMEQNYVLEALPRFDELTDKAKTAEIAHADSKTKPDKLNLAIKQIEFDVVEHRRPAEELNRDLCSYLGHNELQFIVQDTGYALKRGEHTAKHLSEGERTAIAFLYFLKSLEDKDFDIKNSVIVIDDPVSSLDSNALFSAFAYMQERTKASHQLFILTHNFSFFRQVRNWFHYMKGQKSAKEDKRPARLYTLRMTPSDNGRAATLCSIDPFLERFESEYHFLFKQVYDITKISELSPNLGMYYSVPNIARRLIETFFAYHLPDCGGSLSNKFKHVDFDSAKKTRILKFLNTYSHSEGISDPEHDPSILSETADVMKNMLDLIKKLDKSHYRGMINIMHNIDSEE